MAQTFQIPFSFEFRKVNVKWMERETRIVGFTWEGPTGTDSDFVLVADTTGHGRKFQGHLSKDDVPRDTWNRCSAAVQKWMREDYGLGFGSAAESEIERICSDLHPRFLFRSPQGDLIDAVSFPADAWQLRDDFLRITFDAPSVLAFLNQWGLWDLWGDVKIRELAAFQKKIRRALLSRANNWLSEAFDATSFDFDKKSTYPYFTMETVECKDAISRSVTIDLLQRERFDICARKDCGQPFRIVSRHSRKYCSQYCAHLESVRRNRARDRDFRIE